MVAYDVWFRTLVQIANVALESNVKVKFTKHLYYGLKPKILFHVFLPNLLLLPMLCRLQHVHRYDLGVKWQGKIY